MTFMFFDYPEETLVHQLIQFNLAASLTSSITDQRIHQFGPKKEEGARSWRSFHLRIYDRSPSHTSRQEAEPSLNGSWNDHHHRDEEETEPHQHDAFVYLPPEILFFNILARLPVKSLLRFRCVCKAWLDTIESPDFAVAEIQMRLQRLARYYRKS
ncbi:hypothetical protein AKJ16_DCAP19385 [Drosera capensis]